MHTAIYLLSLWELLPSCRKWKDHLLNRPAEHNPRKPKSLCSLEHTDPHMVVLRSSSCSLPVCLASLLNSMQAAPHHSETGPLHSPLLSWQHNRFTIILNFSLVGLTRMFSQLGLLSLFPSALPWISLSQYARYTHAQISLSLFLSHFIYLSIIAGKWKGASWKARMIFHRMFPRWKQCTGWSHGLQKHRRSISPRQFFFRS